MTSLSYSSVPKLFSSGVVISEIPGYHVLWHMSSQQGSLYISLKTSVSSTRNLPPWIYRIFLPHETPTVSKVREPDKIESYTIPRLVALIFDVIVLVFWLWIFCEWGFSDFLTSCGKKLEYSPDSRNFFMKRYLPLLRKDSVTYVNGLAVYMKDVLPLTRDCSPENSENSNLFSIGFSSFFALFIFFCRSPSLLYEQLLMLFYSP